MTRPLVLLCALAVAASMGATGCDGGAADGLGEGEGEAGEGEGEAGEGEGEAGEGEGEAGEGEGEGEGEPYFVAVGYGGRRLTSPDGTLWENDTEIVANGGDDDNLWRAVCVGDGLAVAVGGSQVGRMMANANEVDFTVFVDDDNWLGGCAIGNGVVAAVGSHRSIRSLDGGLTWVDADQDHFYPGGGWEMRDATYLDDGTPDGLFVAGGDLGISVSTDAGVSWTAPGVLPDTRAVAAGNGRVVAIGGGKRSFSDDGIVWTTVDQGGLRDVFFDGTRFVVVGDQLTHFSDDGETWDEQASNRTIDMLAFGDVDGAGPAPAVYVGATFLDQRFVSTDAMTWTNTGSGGTNIISGVAFVP